MSKPIKRLLGMTADGKALFAPKHSHSLLLSAAGGGKTSCGAVPWLLSLLAAQGLIGACVCSTNNPHPHR